MTSAPRDKVFVFGSNLLGIHGAGAAKEAYKSFGAKWGIGVGHVGNSYAIPTKRTPRERMPLDEIQEYILEFVRYAREHSELNFYVTEVGCGLAGYRPKQIAPSFMFVGSNVKLPQSFIDVLL